jgi:hypothetical protein
MNRNCLLAAATLLVVLSGCSSGHEQPSSPSATVTKTVTVTVTPKPSVPPDAHLGDTRRVQWGTVTPLKVDQVVPVVDSIPGAKTWMGVLVRTCVTRHTKKGKPISLSWDPWTVSDRSGGTYASFYWTNTAYPEPIYPDARVIPIGQCVKGWIVFNKPKGVRPVSVSYAPANADASVWKF